MQLVLAILAIILSIGVNVGVLVTGDAFHITLPPGGFGPPEVKSKGGVTLEEPPKFWSFRTREIEKLLEGLKKGQAGFVKREKVVADMENVIALEKKELEVSRKEITDLRDKFLARIIEIEKEEIRNLKKLAETYTNMPPESVTQIFSDMEDVLVVKILSRMDVEVTAGIFQAMIVSSSEGKDRVAHLSKLMRLSEEKKS